jgi:hypothetical protein
MIDVTQMSPAPMRTGSPPLVGVVVGVAVEIGMVEELAFAVGVAAGGGVAPVPLIVTARVGECVDSRLARLTAAALGSTMAR